MENCVVFRFRGLWGIAARKRVNLGVFGAWQCRVNWNPANATTPPRPVWWLVAPNLHLMGVSLGFCLNCWDKMAPTPTSEASTSTTNGLGGVWVLENGSYGEEFLSFLMFWHSWIQKSLSMVLRSLHLTALNLFSPLFNLSSNIFLTKPVLNYFARIWRVV